MVGGQVIESAITEFSRINKQHIGSLYTCLHCLLLHTCFLLLDADAGFPKKSTLELFFCLFVCLCECVRACASVIKFHFTLMFWRLISGLHLEGNPFYHCNNPENLPHSWLLWSLLGFGIAFCAAGCSDGGSFFSIERTQRSSPMAAFCGPPITLCQTLLSAVKS